MIAATLIVTPALHLVHVSLKGGAAECSLCTAVLQLEDERSALRSQVSVLREKQASLEEELKSRAVSLVQMGQEAAQARAEASALRSTSFSSCSLGACVCV